MVLGSVTVLFLVNRHQPEGNLALPGGPATAPRDDAPEAPPEPTRATDAAPKASEFPSPIEPGAVLVPGEPLSISPSAEPLQELVPEESEVQWDERPIHPPLDDSRLSDSQRQAVQSSPVPVLLPDNDQLLTAALISIGDYFYAASMDEEGVSVLVTGASKVVRVPGTPDPPSFGDHERTLSRSEGIVDLNFKAYGVYYDVSVECFDPFNDPRCVQDAYMLDVADNLMLAAAARTRGAGGNQ